MIIYTASRFGKFNIKLEKRVTYLTFYVERFDKHSLFLILAQIPPNEVEVPHNCNMGAASSCKIIIGVWTLGLSGHCLPNAAGIRIGPGHYTQIAIQVSLNSFFLYFRLVVKHSTMEHLGFPSVFGYIFRSIAKLHIE